MRAACPLTTQGTAMPEKEKKWCHDVGYWIERCEKFGEERDDAHRALALTIIELHETREMFESANKQMVCAMDERDVARTLAEQWKDHADSLLAMYDADPLATGIAPDPLPWRD